MREAPPDNLDRAEWRRRRDNRLALARRAVVDADARGQLLGAWRFGRHGGLLAELTAGLEVPDAPDIRRIVGWVEAGEPPEASAPSEEAWDRRIVASTEGREVDGAERAAAGLYLLGRLGEEVARREHDAWRDKTWPSHTKDAAAAKVWEGLLSPRPVWEASAGFRKLWSDPVARAFAGVAVLLRLPPEVGQAHAKQAGEQLDLLMLGAHLDIASRLVETAGEPVEALVQALGDDGLQRVRPCFGKRLTWSQAWAALERRGRGDPLPVTLAEAADLSVFLALVRALEAAALPQHPLGLPGWGIVQANRTRIRGRLRAVCRQRPELVWESLKRLPGLFERTAAAVARYAWAWAWREARSGFGFDAGRLSSPPCLIDPRDVALHRPFDEAEVRQITTFLLLVIGRGCWEDLNAWLAGADSQTLSKSFYRCVLKLPDTLADPRPEGQRVRRYRRLQGHLEGDGIETYRAVVTKVARRVARLKDGRGLKEALHAALRPDWDEASFELPAHHLPTFLTSFGDFLAAGPAPTDEPPGEA